MNNVSIDQITTAITNNLGNIIVSDEQLNQFFRNVSLGSTFVDYSQAITVANTQSLESESFPFDCLLMWSSTSATVLVNGFNPAPYTISYYHTSSSITSAYNKMYLESGSSLTKEKNKGQLSIIPATYGKSILQFTDYNLIDFLPDSSKYSQLAKFFNEISVYGNSGDTQSTEIKIENVAQATAQTYSRWKLKLKPYINIIFSSGESKPYYSKVYDYPYFCAYYSVNTSYNNSWNISYTTGGKTKLCLTKNQQSLDNYLTVLYTSMPAKTSTISSRIPKNATFFANSFRVTQLTGVTIS